MIFDLSSDVPSKPIWWLCTFGTHQVHVLERLWIDARKEAAKVIGCMPESVHAEPDTRATGNSRTA